MTVFALGDRVVMRDGTVGIVEAIDDEDPQFVLVDVRCLTPNNERSVLISITTMDSLRDGSNVLPQPMSKKWWAESRAFCAEVEAALMSIDT